MTLYTWVLTKKCVTLPRMQGQDLCCDVQCPNLVCDTAIQDLCIKLGSFRYIGWMCQKSLDEIDVQSKSNFFFFSHQLKDHSPCRGQDPSKYL